MHSLFVIYNCRQRRSRLNAALCGISSGSTLFAKTKMLFREKKMQFCLEIKTCNPLNYIMNYSKFIASIQIEEFISSFKSFANYYIQQQSLNYMYIMKHQNIVNFVLLSFTELYLQQIMQVSC